MTNLTDYRAEQIADEAAKRIVQSELKPCPFCGGEAEYGLTVAGEEVYCMKCKAAVPRITTKEAAIEAWNTRAERVCEPIVRCKDCAHYNDYHGKCHRPALILTKDKVFWSDTDSDILSVGHAEPNGFCAWGKRKVVEE